MGRIILGRPGATLAEVAGILVADDYSRAYRASPEACEAASDSDPCEAQRLMGRPCPPSRGPRSCPAYGTCPFTPPCGD